jgi:hypothetical protein
LDLFFEQLAARSNSRLYTIEHLSILCCIGHPLHDCRNYSQGEGRSPRTSISKSLSQIKILRVGVYALRTNSKETNCPVLHTSALPTWITFS